MPWVPATTIVRRCALIAGSRSLRRSTGRLRFASRHHLGIPIGDRCADRNQLSITDMVGVVPDMHLHPLDPKPLEDRSTLEVGSAHGVSHRVKDRRNRSHTGTACTH